MNPSNEKKRIGILTTFYKWDTSYSLTSVVENQLIANVKYGYPTVLLAHDNFEDAEKLPAGVELRKVIPRFNLVDYSDFKPVEEGFGEQVRIAKQALLENLKDIDVVIAHDLIFQGWFLPYCVAIHQIQDEKLLPKIKWLFWTHSAPSIPPRDIPAIHQCRYHLPIGDCRLVYLNNHHSLKLAESYNTWLSRVRVIYNAIDPRTFWPIHHFVKQLIDRYDLLEADVMAIYPVSATRMVDGKQVQKAIKVMASIKKLGKSVRYIVCTAHANGENEKKAIVDLQVYGAQLGLYQHELIFTGPESAEYEQTGIPRGAISQLFQLSNLFIFPSVSENCSLVLLEAMLAKNLLVLNNSFAPMREFGRENALYFDFGANGNDVKYDNEDGYYEDIAKIILSQLAVNWPLNAQRYVLKNFNIDVIFRQLEQLYYEL